MCVLLSIAQTDDVVVSSREGVLGVRKKGHDESPLCVERRLARWCRRHAGTDSQLRRRRHF